MGSDIDVGRVIAGKYELVRLIGKGAMGEVWLATHDTLGGEFAIKLVKPSDDDEDDSAAGRFQLEAQISAKLSRRTRHIVSVSDHGEEEGLAYLVMELLEGESLEGRIERTRQIPLVETVAIVMQVARALEQAHAEGIFHRDLKPANIFLTKDEDGRLLVKLLDFGIARSSKPVRTRSKFATGKDMVLGTPSYMSPEQARGLDSLDHRCDLWALAVVAFESLAGEIPWEGDSVEDIFLAICTFRFRSIASLRPGLPFGVGAVFERAFAQELNDRFNTAMELSVALESLVDPDEVEALTRGVARGSGRRLPAASDHDIPSAMALVGPRENATDPNLRALGPTAFMQKTDRPTGWLVGIVAAGVTIALVLLFLRALTTHSAAAKEPPQDNPPVVASSATNPPVPPPTAEPVTTPAAAASTAAPRTTVSKPIARPSPPGVPAKPTAAAPPVTVAPATPQPPPVVTAAPTPVRPAPTTPDRGNVF